jgi:hypothetical protein
MLQILCWQSFQHNFSIYYYAKKISKCTQFLSFASTKKPGERVEIKALLINKAQR